MIESVAPADEHDSPFHSRNKEICEELERYINQKKGQTAGEYSSWHIEVEGSFAASSSWKIQLEKSTTTAISGTLIRNSTVIGRLTVEARNCRHFPEDIDIRRADFRGRVVRLFSPNTEYLDDSRNYLVTGSTHSELVAQVTAVLENQLAARSVAHVRYDRRHRNLVIAFDQLMEDFSTLDDIVRLFDAG